MSTVDAEYWKGMTKYWQERFDQEKERADKAERQVEVLTELLAGLRTMRRVELKGNE